jgi:CarboxypepD_reg-like domain
MKLRFVIIFLLSLGTLPGYAQQSIQGAVVGIRGQPLPFAHVFLRQQKMGTYTNEEGNFILRLPAQFSQDTLEVSFLGYRSSRVAIGTEFSPSLRIQLTEAVTELAELTIKAESAEEVLLKMARLMWQNQPNVDVGYEAFFREKQFYGGALQNYSEALLNIYAATTRPSEVELLKGRRLVSPHQEKVSLKWGGSPYQALGSEGARLAKSAFFLDSTKFEHYKYRIEALLAQGKQQIYRIAFVGVPKHDFGWEDGLLYIDATTYAVIAVRYRLNEKGRKREMNQSMGALRSMARLLNGVSMSLASKEVSVDYQQLPNGRWGYGRVFQQTVLDVAAKRKGSKNSSIKFGAELAVFRVEVKQPQPIPSSQQLPRNKSLPTSEKEGKYDLKFWEKFNQLLPEKDVLATLEEK